MGKKRETAIFVQSRRPRGWGCLLWLLILVVIVVGGVWAANDIASRKVNLIKQPISRQSMPRDLEGFTILHISDLNGAELGKNQAMIATALGKSTYDVVCITGDMVGDEGKIQPFLDLLSLLHKDVPILFIPGECDPNPVISTAHDTLSVFAPYITAIQAAGVTYLDNPYPMTVGKTTVWFTPESLYTIDAQTTAASCQSHLDELKLGPATADTEAETRAWEYRLDAANRLIEARLHMKSTDFHVALSHAPLTYDYVRSVWDWQADQGVAFKNINLALAGHFCGGQWRVPGGRAIYVPELGWFPEEQLVSGLSRVSTIPQYISPGLGSSCSYPLQPGRLFNPSAITLLTLTAKPQ